MAKNTLEIPNTKYHGAVGRRKTSTARVRLYESKKDQVAINDVELSEYFPTSELQNIVLSALNEAEAKETFFVSAHVSGGGIHSQAEAVRHGIARALVAFNETNRSSLKRAGYLKRDPREVERKKFGLKKARKSAQWSKR